VRLISRIRGWPSAEESRSSPPSPCPPPRPRPRPALSGKREHFCTT
jgi:hypothetical protein